MRYARTFARFGYGEGELVEQAKSGLKCLDVVPDRDVYILYQDNKQPDYTVTYTADISAAKAGDVVGTITLRDEFGNVRTAEAYCRKGCGCAGLGDICRGGACSHNCCGMHNRCQKAFAGKIIYNTERIFIGRGMGYN